MTKFGRVKKVNLRDVWSNEANDFTPWLAQVNNLFELSEELGISLELVGTEQQVGLFRADIVCKNTLDDSWVLIENQLEKTDHNHLGQLLTYAAGLDAVTIIWIAKRFREEHRAALDWLNSVTDEHVNFFGIEIELLQIDDSPVAPSFNITSQPNNWTRSVQAVRRSVELSVSDQLHLEYWTEFMNFVEENSTLNLSNRKPSSRYWMDFPIGRRYFNFALLNGLRDGYLRAELVVKGENAVEHFNLLLEQRDSIEEQFGTSLVWDYKPSRRNSQKIQYDLSGVDASNADNWQEYHEWHIRMLEKFYDVFQHRVLSLTIND